MVTANDAIVHNLTASKRMLLWFVEDLTPTEFLHRPAANVNCVAWLLGHLTLTDRRVAGTILGANDFPPLPDGFERRFSRDEGCPTADEFADVSILPPLFARHRDVLIATVNALPPEALARPLPTPHPRFKTAGEAANFMSVHTAMHAGQISVIRRSLGRPPLI
jgi:uncharacterized damage-inducible protein DinB